MERPKILIIEDAIEVANLLKRGLSEEGFDIQVAHTGESGLRFAQQSWDLILLDLMLPDLSGETILTFLAQRLDRPPVLVLTAKGGLEDKVSCFRQGCDDYLTKPFEFEELLGRVRALLRRSQRVLSDECKYEDIRLEPSTFRLTIGNDMLNLTPKEFAICRLLMNEPGRVISRKELLHSVWGLTHEPRTNFIEVHLTHLRKKLSQLGRERWLQTVRAAGFMFSRPENYGS